MALYGISGIVGDGEALPIKDDAFETVCCHDVMEHVSQPDKLIDEMVRVCRRRKNNSWTK